MDSFLELKGSYDVDDLLKINIKGSSFGFSGEAECYVNESSFLEFAESLNGFPKEKNQSILFTCGKSNELSTFDLEFTSVNNSGHIKVEVVITHIDNFQDSIIKRYSSSFGFIIMPADIDIFQKSLVKVADFGNKGAKAVLYKKT